MIAGDARPRCSWCGTHVVWAITAERGARIPLESGPDPEGRYVDVSAGPPRVVRALRRGDAAPEGVKRWTSHFATCHATRRKTPRRILRPDSTCRVCQRPLLDVDGFGTHPTCDPSPGGDAA